MQAEFRSWEGFMLKSYTGCHASEEAQQGSQEIWQLPLSSCKLKLPEFLKLSEPRALAYKVRILILPVRTISVGSCEDKVNPQVGKKCIYLPTGRTVPIWAHLSLFGARMAAWNNALA